MQINIYHTNDIHSNYHFLKKVHKYLSINKTENDLYLDSGDFTDLKDLVVQADKGYSAIDLIKYAYLDYQTIGNNEIDLGYDDLKKLASKANYVCCNLTDNFDKSIENIKPYVIVQKANIRFLIIGISPYYNHQMLDNNFNAFFTLYGLQVKPSIDIVKRIIKENKGKYDYSILLAHNGFYTESQIVEAIGNIDFCLGGHSHEVVNEDHYMQNGGGEYLGKLTLQIDENKIEVVANEQIELTDEDDLDFDLLLQEKKQFADSILQAPLQSVDDLLFDPLNECMLINFVCDSLYKHFDGDFAIMHNGIANNSLTKPISRKSIIETFPSKLNPTMYTIKGNLIYEAIIMSFDEERIKENGKGAGFRGYILGTLSFSHNVKIDIGNKLVYINGELLDLNKEYKIITDDYLQRGTGYPSLKVSDDLATWDVWFIRDLILHCIDDWQLYEQAKIQRYIKNY